MLLLPCHLPRTTMCVVRSNTLFFPIPTVFILPLLFTFTRSSSCPSSSCGNITEIRHPFRLKTDPSSCGHSNTTYFQLDCQNNHTVLSVNSKRYFVQKIDYKKHTIRLADPGINRTNLSSCPLYSNSDQDWPWPIFIPHFVWDGFITIKYFNTSVAFIHCLSPVNSVKYVKAPFCGNRSNYIMSRNSSKFYGYVIVGDNLRLLDLEESCTVDKVVWGPLAMMHNSSLENIYDHLAYGFTLEMFSCLYGECDLLQMKAILLFVAFIQAIFIVLVVVGLVVLRCVIGCMIGYPFLIWLVVHKLRRRHLSMDKGIEEFLQEHPNLTPRKYTYLQIKKMTCNFNKKLGEGSCGTVYKGKLRNGISVAIKLMKRSKVAEEDFVNEVGSIGRIHHVNVVRLLGFCAERSKYALMYEFLPNGSLEMYTSNQQSSGHAVLTYEKTFEIALGVAHGINYLHHGCDMQILHFDIKPHNILLDEKFNPKISDFGLALLHPRDESYINLTTVRGTVGYMAPEMFYKNLIRISYKADVYSFGMMLMEMASRRKNVNQYVEDTSEIYFPSWAYDQLCAKEDIEIHNATEGARKMVKKIIIAALWCIQMRPSDRPGMNKVIEILESESQPKMPRKLVFARGEMAANGSRIVRTL